MVSLLKRDIHKALLVVAIAHLFIGFSYSQNVQTFGFLAGKVQLPQHFSRFSTDDVLTAVFPEFDRSTGRVSHILNEQKQPALVRLNQARLWKSGGQNYLVVMIDISNHDDQFGESGLCGGCATASPIAVLREVGGRLELVAKQEDDFYRSADGEDRSTGFESFWYTGHDSDIAFDLAPYRLNSKELLIGVRYQHIWTPAYSFSTTLLLYRVEGNRIRKVFGDLVVDREWENGPAQYFKMEKNTSTLMSVPAKGPFHNLVVVKKTRGCTTDSDILDCFGGRLLKTTRETWQFDGASFEKTN